MARWEWLRFDRGSTRSTDAEARLLAVIQGSDDAIIATDLAGVVTAWSHGAETLYGYTADRMIGTHISLIYPEGEAAHMGDTLRSVARGEPSGDLERTRRHADGTPVDVKLRMYPIFDGAGAVIGISAIARDIRGRLRRELELSDSQEFLERTQAIGKIGSWKTQIGPESILTWTPETYRIFGIEPGTTVRNLDFFNLVHPDDRERLLETFVEVRSNGRRAEMELRFTRADGASRWLFLAAEAQIDDAGGAVGMTGIVQDITERKETEFRFAHDAFHDQLTGLPNRDLFLDRVARSVTRTRRGTSKVAVLYLDVDHFAVFNNARGNEYGDTVLRAVADRLCSVMRVTDSVARFSADEFGIVCENIANAADAARRAQRVLDAVAEPFVLDGGEALITVSIGIALSEPDATSEALVRDADLAMHRAKGEGRNRFELYDLGLRQEIQQHFALETALRRAVDNGELFLEFQPIASLCDNRYVGAEALIRWKHPERGVVKPDDFIPIAERTGLIVPIGTWVLQTACQQLRLWRDAAPEGGNWRVSVNVAAAQLDAPDFPDVVEQSLQQAGLEGVALRIELTESAFIDGSVVTDALQRIRALGVRISIDDFGTKYASLSYLTRLSIDALKIDQSFIEELIGNASNQAVVSAILAIGQALGLDVTAEGVKTEAQLDELRRLGCKLAQGYYFSKPLSPKDCLAVLLGPLEPNGSRS